MYVVCTSETMATDLNYIIIIIIYIKLDSPVLIVSRHLSTPDIINSLAVQDH